MRAVTFAIFAGLTLLGASPSQAQVAGVPAASTGIDLKSQAEMLVAGAGAAEAFEAMSDTRFVTVRHKNSGFLCTFMPGSEVDIEVFAGGGQGPNDDVRCTEYQGPATMEFRVTRFNDGVLDELIGQIVEQGKNALTDPVQQSDGPPPLSRSPAPPFVPLTAPRRQAVLIGTAEGQPVMQRIAIAQLPGKWFVLQRYSVALPQGDATQVAIWAAQGAGLAEQVFAAKLGEFSAPAPDPALR